MLSQSNKLCQIGGIAILFFCPPALYPCKARKNGSSQSGCDNPLPDTVVRMLQTPRYSFSNHGRIAQTRPLFVWSPAKPQQPSLRRKCCHLFSALSLFSSKARSSSAQNYTLSFSPLSSSSLFASVKIFTISASRIETIAAAIPTML